MADVRIIGIDPGPKSVGYAYVEGKGNNVRRAVVGSLKFRDRAEGERLSRLFDSLQEIIGRFLPEAMAVEDVYTRSNPRLSLRIGEVKGVIKMCCWRNSVDYFEYTPSAVKKQVGGNGSASKREIRRALKFYVGNMKFPDEHCADALAVAICHLMRSR